MNANVQVDAHLLKALRLQQESYTALNWEAKLTTSSVRVTPLSVVVAPAQRLSWDGSGAASRPTWMLRMSRVWAVVKGLAAAMTGQGGAFALLVDCRLEVDEEFKIIDLDTGQTIVVELGQLNDARFHERMIDFQPNKDGFSTKDGGSSAENDGSFRGA